MVAMHVSIGMPSAAFMVYLSVNVWVCVCMVDVHVNRSWKKKPRPNLVIKKKCCAPLENKSSSAQRLLLSNPHRICTSWLSSRALLRRKRWSVERLCECMLFLLNFHQAVWKASVFIVCFFLFFLSSCELLLGTNLPQVLPPFDVILILNLNPNSVTLQKENTKKKKKKKY